MPQTYADLVAQRDALINRLPVGKTSRRQQVLDAWELSESPDDFLSQIADIPGSDDVKRQLASTWNTAYTYVTAPSPYEAGGEAEAALDMDAAGTAKVRGGIGIPAIATPLGREAVLTSIPGQILPAIGRTAEGMIDMAGSGLESAARGIQRREMLPTDTLRGQLARQFVTPGIAAGLEVTSDLAGAIAQQSLREAEAMQQAPDVMGKVRGAVRTIPAVGPLIEETVSGMLSPDPEIVARTIAQTGAEAAVPYATGRLVGGTARSVSAASIEMD